ncbi:MAG: PsiF repeat protein [Rhizobacter sp.]|jgi:hypothetical protein|nr:PsiF repeat protein [Rhizobacter sp.]MBP6269107.1 PsiF repeat protein [Rhizobacter sp.]HOX67723.1 PsiF family protein [Burkholderiaceae bacterium]
MKNLMIALIVCTAALSGTAYANSHKEAPEMAAAASAPEMGKQQSKMTTCNKDAGEMKGDERKAFMKKCLSAKKPTQQEKMKTCNAEAKGKTGEERKDFMKSCLSS